MATLDLVIKETLRLVAPVPIVMRKTIENVEIAGRHIPADTLVAVAPAVNHFDESCWTEPDTFGPDRFSEPRGTRITVSGGSLRRRSAQVHWSALRHPRGQGDLHHMRHLVGPRPV